MPAHHLYVHVPFCARRCAYCDFSIAVRREVPVADYVIGIRRELELRAGPNRMQLDTLYFGGGTPSRIGGDGILTLTTTVREFANLRHGAEVTMEVNPDDVNEASVNAWLAAGVNRFSLGVQTFNPDLLNWMHRVHSADDSIRAFQTLRSVGARNISVDLIFALPGELARDWRNDLEQVLALDPEHVSLYGLTVEAGTPLQRWVDRGTSVSLSDERYSEEFLVAHELLTSNGFDHYEVSNFGKPGFRSRHNSAYWSGAEYAAVGPSAHRFDGVRREWNIRHYAAWLQSLNSGELPTDDSEHLTDDNRAVERIYLGLRTSDGLALDLVGDIATVHAWRDAGWAELDQHRVKLTAEGWLRLDSLAADLTLSRSNF